MIKNKNEHLDVRNMSSTCFEHPSVHFYFLLFPIKIIIYIDYNFRIKEIP